MVKAVMPVTIADVQMGMHHMQVQRYASQYGIFVCRRIGSSAAAAYGFVI
jgi:hypothetical protein